MTNEKKQSEYSKLLRDPRWQKKRLEILSRDNFTCQSCTQTEITLHVHHCYYDRQLMPWDYPSGSLVTLCEVCHQDETDARPLQSKIELCNALSSWGFLSDHFFDLSRQIHMANKPGSTDQIFYALVYILSNSEALGKVLTEADDYYESLRKSYESYLEIEERKVAGQ